MKVFVIGKHGFIAHEAINFLKADFNLRDTTSEPTDKEDIFLDLSDPESFCYDLISEGDVILHLAAVSSPDACMNNKDFAYKVNVSGSIFFITECLERGAKVLFFSSDTVYRGNIDGLDEYFDENSECEPTVEYGKMKLEVEKVFLNRKNFKVFRLSYVFSSEDKFTSYLMNCLARKEPAEVFHPFFRSVVYIRDLLCAIKAIISDWEEYDQQVFNICGTKLISRKDIAEAFKKNVDDSIELKVVKPGENFYSARPKAIIMKSLYLDKLLGRKPLGISEAMKHEFRKEEAVL